jgi:Uma2 family endonuclease
MRAVARVPPFDRPATFEDLKHVPDQMVAEVVDGELHTNPRPALPHARASSRLGSSLGPPFDEGLDGPGGWIILDEPELHLGPHILVPDLAGWRRERLPAVPNAAASSLSPDWVCEVLSPATASLDRVKKLTVYGREHVAWLWFIDPTARTLEVLRLDEGRWAIVAVHEGHEVVRAEPFAALALELRRLWID